MKIMKIESNETERDTAGNFKKYMGNFSYLKTIIRRIEP
jgi:hypothetical protein